MPVSQVYVSVTIDATSRRADTGGGSTPSRLTGTEVFGSTVSDSNQQNS
jgi:hypothetical protein